MNEPRLLIEFQGTYGGSASRDEILRALKEALALVEHTGSEAELSCAGIRIEVLREADPEADAG